MAGAPGNRTRNRTMYQVGGRHHRSAPAAFHPSLVRWPQVCPRVRLVRAHAGSYAPKRNPRRIKRPYHLELVEGRALAVAAEIRLIARYDGVGCESDHAALAVDYVLLEPRVPLRLRSQIALKESPKPFVVQPTAARDLTCGELRAETQPKARKAAVSS